MWAQQGGIKVAVALLDAGGVAAEHATKAIFHVVSGSHVLSRQPRGHDNLVREAGGIPPLVALLGAGADSRAAESAAQALGQLGLFNAVNRAAIREAGGIPPLIALLGAGADSRAAESAAHALGQLASSNQAAIREAGGIPPLIALLRAGVSCADSSWLRYFRPGTKGCSADALCTLAENCANEVLEAVARAGVSTSFHSQLHRRLQDAATACLEAAEAGNDVPALELAIRNAMAVSLPDATVQRANERRLVAINGEAALQKRRESLGLSTLALPDEFVCPITVEKMRDPVVASDGNSYERNAIAAVLQSPNPCSPLTREPLEQTLFPNRNLKKRIEEHEVEVLNVAELAAAVAVADERSKRSAEQAAGSSSSEPASKRSCRRRP